MDDIQEVLTENVCESATTGSKLVGFLLGTLVGTVTTIAVPAIVKGVKKLSEKIKAARESKQQEVEQIETATEA